MFQQARQTDTVQKMKIPKLQLLYDFFVFFKTIKVLFLIFLSLVGRVNLAVCTSVSVEKKIICFLFLAAVADLYLHF